MVSKTCLDGYVKLPPFFVADKLYLEEQPTPSEEVTSEAQPTPTEAPTVLSAQPAAPEVEAAPAAEPAPLQISLWLIIGIVAGSIFTGVIIWQLVARRKAS